MRLGRGGDRDGRRARDRTRAFPGLRRVKGRGRRHDLGGETRRDWTDVRCRGSGRRGRSAGRRRGDRNGADVADWDVTGALVEQAMSTSAGSTVVNNAGILRDRNDREGTSIEEWDLIMRVDRRGHSRTSRDAAADRCDPVKAVSRSRADHQHDLARARPASAEQSPSRQGRHRGTNYLRGTGRARRYGVTATTSRAVGLDALMEGVFVEKTRRSTWASMSRIRLNISSSSSL